MPSSEPKNFFEVVASIEGILRENNREVAKQTISAVEGLNDVIRKQNQQHIAQTKEILDRMVSLMKEHPEWFEESPEDSVDDNRAGNTETKG